MRKYILIFCVLVYLAGLMVGLVHNNYEKFDSTPTPKTIKEYLGTEQKEIFRSIFINNTCVVLINFAGLFSFGIISCANVFYNGFILGDVVRNSLGVLSFDTLLGGLLPHSFELIGYFWSALLGIETGFKLLMYIFFQKPLVLSYKRLIYELILCILIILIAAFVESYVSIH